MTNRGARAGRASLVIFALMLISASAISLTIILSPFVTVSDPGAVSIGASLAPIQVTQNQTIKATISDKNGLLLFENKLPVPSNGALGQNLTMGLRCGWVPFGIAVFEGNFALDNITSAKVVGYIYDAAVLNGCGGLPSSNYFKFNPGQEVSASLDFSGYYTAQLTGKVEGYFHPFTPGEYTVLAGDAWGHQEVLHFKVTSS